MKSDSDWCYWGSKDPMFAVASWKGKEAGSPTAWTAEEFMKLGASDMADVLAQWRQFGLAPGRCIEVGCGAGRMTAPLLTAFDSVLALDVSPDQIEKAKAHLSQDLKRVDFRVVTAPSIPAESGTCSGMFSCHVFQHFSEFSGIAAYLREAYRALSKNGTICFHLPVQGAHLGADKPPLLLSLRNLYAQLKRVLGSRRAWEYHRYETKEVFKVLSDTGFVQIELRIFAMTSNGDFHSYFFARKP